MRRLLLLFPLLLAGCVNDSASYYIDGSDHALTVRAEQEYFWEPSVRLYVTASRLPDCQRRFALPATPLAGLQLDLYAAGEQSYTVRSGNQAWSVETAGCTELAATPAGEPQYLGSFRIERERMVFLPAQAGGAGPASATTHADGAVAASPAPAAPGAGTPTAAEPAVEPPAAAQAAPAAPETEPAAAASPP